MTDEEKGRWLAIADTVLASPTAEAGRTGFECQLATGIRELVAEVDRLRDVIPATCGACGHTISLSDGTCGCDDNRRHPVAAIRRSILDEQLGALKQVVHYLEWHRDKARRQYASFDLVGRALSTAQKVAPDAGSE